ncbi:MAG: MATE family efflux transporter [Paracoccaceae bacterium]|nr:MATE family efflux transporter [Paracoccaceae bacterium]
MSTIEPQPVSAPGAGFHARRLLVLGLPLIGSRLAQFAIGMTDTVMIGRYDVTALAALTIATTFFFVLFLVGSGFATAVSPMVASALAEGDTRRVRRITRMGLWLSALYAAVAVPVMLVGEPLLLALGQDPEVARLGGLYLSVAAWGLPPALVVMTMTSYFSALERTRAILIVTIGTAVLNALINYALIFGNFGAPELGLVGAALASATINVVGAAALLVHALRATPENELLRNIWRPDWPVFTGVFRLGWPIGLTWLSEVGLFGGASVMMGWVGKVELAAHGIALQVASATFMVHLGLSQAATVRAGRAWGARDREGLRGGAGVAMGMSMAFVAVTVAVFLTMPGLLVGLFVDPADPARPALLAAGVVLLAYAALFQLFDAGQVMALGLLRGIQDTRVPMVMAALSYWGIGFPAAYILGILLGLDGPGIWLGLSLGLAVAAGLLNWRFWQGRMLRGL